MWIFVDLGGIWRKKMIFLCGIPLVVSTCDFSTLVKYIWCSCFRLLAQEVLGPI